MDKCCAFCFVSSFSTLLVDAITQDGIDNDKDPLDSDNLLLYAEHTYFSRAMNTPGF